MALKDIEIQNIIKGCFRLNIVHARISGKCFRQSPIRGAGFFEIETDGKIFVNIVIERKYYESPNVSWDTPGKFWPKDQYVKLFAFDENGDFWVSEKFIPTGVNNVSKRYLVIAGYPEFISKIDRSSHQFKRKAYAAYFMCEEKFPFTNYEITTKKIRKTETRKGFSLNSTIFQFSKHKFIFHQNEHFLFAEVSGQFNSKLDYASKKSIDGLNLVLGKVMRPIVSSERKKPFKTVTTIFHCERNNRSCRIQPPINELRNGFSGHIWNLYKKYTDYIVKERPESEKLAQLVFLLIQSSDGSFPAACIGWATCLEGILNCFAKTRNWRLNKKELKEIENAQEIIEKSKELNPIKKRINGWLGSIKKMSAQKIFFRMKEKYKLSEKYFNSWKSIRNPTAHGDFEKIELKQKSLDDLYSVLSLFYQIVFALIRYEGKFNDYGENGWHEKNFRKTAQQMRRRGK